MNCTPRYRCASRVNNMWKYKRTDIHVHHIQTSSVFLGSSRLCGKSVGYSVTPKNKCYMNVCTHTYICTCTSTYSTHIPMYMYIHVYQFKHTHTYTQITLRDAESSNRAREILAGLSGIQTHVLQQSY